MVIHEMCLGEGIVEAESANGIKFWTLSSEKHEKFAVSSIETKLDEPGMRL